MRIRSRSILRFAGIRPSRGLHSLPFDCHCEQRSDLAACHERDKFIVEARNVIAHLVRGGRAGAEDRVPL